LKIATMQMSKNIFSSISRIYQLRDMKNSWNIPRVKIKQNNHFKEFWHFLKLLLSSNNMVMFGIKSKWKLHDRKGQLTVFSLLNMHLTLTWKNFCTQRSIFRLLHKMRHDLSYSQRKRQKVLNLFLNHNEINLYSN
jgi:hypothetical protein